MQIFLFCVFISVYVFIIFCTFFYFIYLVMRRSYSCYLSCLLSDSSKTCLFFCLFIVAVNKNIISLLTWSLKLFFSFSLLQILVVLKCKTDQKKYFYDFCFQIKLFVYTQISDVMCWLLSDSSLISTPATLKIIFIFIVIFAVINSTTQFSPFREEQT